FSINELPDLAERIQVGLLNVLEERDIQVRGYKIRLPLDLMLVASANPEDYTNRGRIITPLKDRFGAQIRTHYPLDTETELDIVPRRSDLEALVSSTAGKVEVESLEEGREDSVVGNLFKAGVLTVFKERCPIDQFRDLLAAFQDGTVVHAGDDVASSEYVDV